MTPEEHAEAVRKAVEAEREACARLCSDRAAFFLAHSPPRLGEWSAAESLAAAIRARGGKTT